MALAAISLVGLVGMFFSGKILGMHEEKLGIFPFDDCCVNVRANSPKPLIGREKYLSEDSVGWFGGNIYE
eukprot:380299-Amorphochlora_amoeboformis.AAC.1